MTDFNSRPSARGDPASPCTQISPLLISIHAPPRGATICTRRWANGIDNFNSRPSARGDHPKNFRQILYIFQFTPLREGRRREDTPPADRLYFNSRPSARGDCDVDNRREKAAISIHAPPRGATSPPTSTPITTAYFNSRPSARGDVHGVCWGYWNLISIHAPPRGATAKDMQFLQIFCSTLTNQHGLTIVPRNLSRLFW